MTSWGAICKFRFAVPCGWAIGVRPHDIFGNKRLYDFLFHRGAKENALPVETVISSQLEQAILLDLNMNYDAWDSSADRGNNGLTCSKPQR